MVAFETLERRRLLSAIGPQVFPAVSESDQPALVATPATSGLNLSNDTFTQAAKLDAADGETNDYFGTSVSVSGNTLVIGSPYAFVNGKPAQGAAYVYTNSSSGWTFAAKLTASDGVGSDVFGFSVSISGNTIVVGAYQATISGNYQQGAAYVFVEPVGGWTNMTQTAKLTASDGVAYDQLGDSVSIDGNTIAVGASRPPQDGQPSGPGAAYIFTKPAGGWVNMTQAAKLTASDGQAGDQLGSKISISGNSVVTTAPYATVSGHADQGAAYVFTEPYGGWVNMTQTATLTASDGAANDRFGWIASIGGSTVIVGAPYATVNGNAIAGAAYEFTEPNAGWTTTTESQKLTASDGQANAKFGVSVFVNGSTMILGANFAAINGNFQEGEAYVFDNTGSGWTQAAELIASDGGAGSKFGWSVSASGNTVLVSAAGATVGGNSAQGAAYVFNATPGPLALSSNLVYVKLDAVAQQIDIWNNTTASGAPSESIPLGNVSSILYSGEAGGDQCIADLSAGDPIPSGGLSITGGSGRNTLELIGATGTDTVTVAASTITIAASFGSASITYANLSTISFSGNPSANNTLIQAAQPGDSASLQFSNPTALDTLTINSGTFTIPARASGVGILDETLGTLSVAAGAQLVLADNDSPSDATILNAGMLALAGKIDITNNTLRATESNFSLSQIRTAVQSGAIMSSLVTGPAAIASRFIGYGDSLEDPGIVPAGDVEARYVPTGDITLDGVVNIADVTRAVNNFNLATDYSGGDLLNDGKVDIADMMDIVNDFNATLGSDGTSAPESWRPAAEANLSAAVAPSLAAASVGSLFSGTSIPSAWLESVASVLG